MDPEAKTEKIWILDVSLENLPIQYAFHNRVKMEHYLKHVKEFAAEHSYKLSFNVTETHSLPVGH